MANRTKGKSRIEWGYTKSLSAPLFVTKLAEARLKEMCESLGYSRSRFLNYMINQAYDEFVKKGKA